MTNRNEQEWWMESPFCDTYRVPQFDPGIAVTLNQTLHVEKIVAEAERRGELKGRVAAWDEALKITKKEMVKWYQPNPGSFIIDKINAKLTELKKV